MYTNHFGLRLAPFEDRADPQFALITPELEETLAALEYAIQYDKGMALVTGDAGLGKTQLVRTLLTRLPASDHAVLLTRSCRQDTDLLLETARGFGVSTSEHRQDRLITRLRNRLSQHAKSEHRCVLMIDQAENLSVDDLHQLATLHDLTANTVRLLAVVLCGQPRTLELLQDRDLERLDQKLFSRQSLRPLTAQETRSYIEHRLRVAGASNGTIVAEDAHEVIHQVACGVPRVINNICHAAMLAAYGADASAVTADIVREVLEGVVIKERTADAAFLGRPVDRQAAEPTQAIPAPPDHGEYDLMHEHPDDHVLSRDRSEYGSYEGADWPPSAEAYGDTNTADALEQKLAQAERVCAATDAKLAQMCAVERHLETLVRAAQRLTPTLRQSLAHHGQSVEQLQERIGSSLADAERRVGEIDARSTRALEVSKNLSGHLIRAEAECDRAEAVSTRLSVVADQLGHSVDDMQARTVPLVDTLQNAEKLRDHLETACQKAEETGKGLSTQIEREQKSCIEGTRQLLAELAETASATTDAAKQKIAATLREATTEAEESAAEVLATVSREISEAHESARSVETLIESLTEHAEERRQSLESSVESLIERVGNASLQLGHLSETSRSVQSSAEDLVKRVREARDSIGPAVEQSEHVTEQVRTARGNLDQLQVTVADRLVDIGRAAEQIEGLRQQAQSCHEIADDLIQRKETIQHTLEALKERDRLTDDCERRVDAMEARFQSAQQLVATAEQFNANLANAKSLAELVQQSDEAARLAVVELGQVRDEVIAVLEDAGRNLALLEHVNESAAVTVETHRGFTERMESLSAQFEDRVVDTKTAIATGEQLLTEFIAQGDSINEQLSALSQRSEALDQRIDASLTKPEGLVAAAREQAEQLERVCLVGRRILANVSSATLAARDHAEALRSAGKHSDEQFATLTKQTRQAAMTLREWVDEAIRAQQRLERTIDVCPGIKETHSRASLEGLGQLAAAQAKTSHRLEERLVSLEEPVAAKVPSQPRGANGEAASHQADSTVPGRSRDVAKLIEDVQRSRSQRAKT